MKKLSLQNAKSMLSRAEMIKINGGYDGYQYDPPTNQAGIYDYVIGAIIDFVVDKVGDTVKEGAKQSAEAHVSGGTQVFIPGSNESIWVNTKK